jgi:hypothetical protein
VGLTPLKQTRLGNTETKYDGEGLQVLLVLNADGTKKLAGYITIDVCKSLNMNCWSSDFESQNLKDSPDPKAEIIYSFSVEKLSENVPLNSLKDEQSSLFATNTLGGNDSLDASLGLNSMGARSNSRQKSTFLGRGLSPADSMAKIFDDDTIPHPKNMSINPTQYGYQNTVAIQSQLSEARNLLFNDSVQDESLSRQNIRALRLSPNTSRSQDRRANSNVKITLKQKGSGDSSQALSTTVSQQGKLVLNRTGSGNQPGAFMQLPKPPSKQTVDDSDDIFVASYPLDHKATVENSDDLANTAYMTSVPGPHWRSPPLTKTDKEVVGQDSHQPDYKSREQDTPMVANRFQHLVENKKPAEVNNLNPSGQSLQEKPQIWNSTLSFGGNALIGQSGFNQKFLQGKERSADFNRLVPEQSNIAGSIFDLSNSNPPDKNKQVADLENKINMLSQKLAESQQHSQSLTNQHSQTLDLMRQRAQTLQSQLEEQHNLVSSYGEQLARKEAEFKSLQQTYNETQLRLSNTSQEDSIKAEKLQKQSKLIEELTLKLKSVTESYSSLKQQQQDSQSKLSSLLQSSDRQTVLEGQLREKDTQIRQLEKEVKNLSTRLATEQNQVIVLEDRVSELENSQLLSKQQQTLSGMSQLAELKQQLNSAAVKHEELKSQLESSAHKILALEDAKTDLEEQVAQYVD